MTAAGNYSLLIDGIRDKNLDSMIVASRHNIRYLTGFTGDYGWLAIGNGDPVFITSSLYIEQASTVIGPPYRVIEAKNGVFPLLRDLGRDFWGTRIGYEADVTTCSEFGRIQSAFGESELVPIQHVIETLRMIKTPEEIDAIRRAQRIAETVFDEALGLLKEGVTECDIAMEIDYRFRRHGGEKPSFETIVAFGENSSKPHAQPSSRKLKPGDVALFDMGTVFDGYASDMTRTVVFGKADPVVKEIYDVVLDAQLAALEGIRANMKCSGADSIARSVIEKAGYGESFVHTLGHGVGLEIHEIPRLSSKDETILVPGMVVTVEPGIYLPGKGGVRIEDMLKIGDDRCENLTEAPKTFLEL